MSDLAQDPQETPCAGGPPEGPVHDALPGREVALGPHTVVRRLLPHRSRRMVGAWCFADHFGPDDVFGGPGMQVPPHPHTGLQTATWLLDGEVRHTDSLGTVQSIRPGALNLMTAGGGIPPAEIPPAGRPPVLHGLQLWIALPAHEAHCPPGFEHHAALPTVAAEGWSATVAIGELMGARSPAGTHTPIVGAEVAAHGTGALELRPEWEHALLLVDGSAQVEGRALEPGSLAYLGAGRREVRLTAPAGARLFLLGGEPFPDELVMWWNFVGRSHEEIAEARADWMAGVAQPDPGSRFGVVTAYDGPPLPAPALPGVRLKARTRRGDQA
jgi:hypothetical protein